MRIWVVGVAGAMLAGWAAAADKPPEPSEAFWVSRPTRAEFQAAEAEVRKAGVFARAVVRCGVADDGTMTDCRVIRETPAGSGFGQALLALTPKYRVAPPGKDDPREITIQDSWDVSDKGGDWLKRPTAQSLMAVFPTEAFKRGISGRAVISCVATVQGALTDCISLYEKPAGMGFGSAGIALTPQFLMKPATLGGKPVTSVIMIPLNFKLGGPMPTAESKKVLPGNLAWSSAPSYADVAAAYPQKAREERKGGRATVACAMSEAGRLKDCEVVTSDPKNYGFDTAAKTLARQFAYPINSDSDRKATHSLSVHLPMTFDPANLDAATPVIGKPLWAGLPSDDLIRSTFGALKVAGTVRVVMSCTVQAGGTVGGCTVESETPTGSGVGAAALTLIPTFRLTTWTAEGLPVVGGTVRIPLRYEGGPAAAAAAPMPTPK